jgi:Minor capsid.
MSYKPRIVTFSVNKAKIKDRLNSANHRAQIWLDNEVLKDTSPYVPRVTGELERSGIAGTRIGSGLLVYNKPYAKPQYYGEFKHSKQAHPLATRRWFHVSKAINRRKWIAGVKKLGGGG